jgi:hypothetical protein
MISQNKIDEAKKFGWDIDPETDNWSSNCIVCGKHSVIPHQSGGACQPCIDKYVKE